MLDPTKYKTNLPYPERPVKPRPPASKHKLIEAKEAKRYLAETMAYNRAMVDHDKQLKAYREDEARLSDQFKQDLIKEYAPNLRPEQAEVVFSKAWEDGHSGGFSEVENEMADLADFLTRLGVKA